MTGGALFACIACCTTPIMLQRTAYGVLVIAALVLLFVEDAAIAREAVSIAGPLGDLLRRGSLIPLLFLVVLLRGSLELNRILLAKGVKPHTVFAGLMVFFLLAAPWWSAAGWLGSGVAQREGLLWQLVGVLVTLLGTGVLTVLRRDPQGTIRDAGATLLTVLYLGFLGGFGIQMRCGVDVPEQEGAWLLLIVLLVTKASDIGAYFTGKAIGRHKLIPSISPGKSVEGVIGGIIGSAAVGALFAALPSWLPAMQATNPAWRTLLHDLTLSFSRQQADGIDPIIRGVLFGVALSIAGQIGDLFESCFKRDSGIKDSGRLLPQYGGILDLVDSPMFAMPVAWFLLTVVWGVV